MAHDPINLTSNDSWGLVCVVLQLLEDKVPTDHYVPTAVLSPPSTCQQGTSLMQAPPPTAMPSVAPEANMSQAPVPASQMLSLQQVEAQQAAQQLLQGQQQPSPAVDHSTPGSVQSGSVSGAGASEAADAGEPSQVRHSCWPLL